MESPAHAFLPVEVEGFDALAELALDLHVSWNEENDGIWRELDQVLWELTRNPWLVLQTVGRERLRRIAADPEFRRTVGRLVLARRAALEAPAWFQQRHPDPPLTCAAYFSMEYLLSEALPIYSGGLGNVAGDQLKTASDLGVPLVGVGLLYQQGYFRQVIDNDGVQHALYPYNDPGQLPITPVREANGEWLRLQVRLSGYSIWLRVWQARVGRVTLYLLDSNDPVNFPAYRGITSELYGGGPELRLQQELLLGIGGWRMLRTLGLAPQVCHLNEGHASFAILERARCFMEETGQPFRVALAVTRAGNLFTTHTPVEAGFDRFSPVLMEQYLGEYATAGLGITLPDLLALGRANPNDDSEPFNMAYLAIRGSYAVNGVSRLHGQVSRQIFQPLFRRWPAHEVPVGHVTNGVYMPGWESAEADTLWEEACGRDRWLGTTEALESRMRRIGDARFWRFRTETTKSLIEYIRERLSWQLTSSGASPREREEARHIFDANVLTICFARRFATYKRPTLLLHDPERLLRILCDPQRPVQLIIAGKAHPADQAGQEMIRQWIRFIRHSQARRRVVFLGDYDMLLTERLARGADVWLNTPRRPWEACGTSGMKVLVNGGLNLSELDGWWAEAYSPQVGWALGDGREHGNDPARDAVEAEELYALLEREVIPEFYNRDASGIPTGWVARMRASMAELTPRFSANRTVREYTERYYLPLAAAYRNRSDAGGEEGERIVTWLASLEKNWTKIRFGEGRVETDGGWHRFQVHLYLDGLTPEAVRVELYAEETDGTAPVRLEMGCGQQLVGAENGYAYEVRVPSHRPTADYTARVLPCRKGVAVPLEAGLILWQR
jgi:starch phosphorylase